MYVPADFTLSDVTAVHAFLRAHVFATIAGEIDGRISFAYAPIVLDTGPEPLGRIRFHLARANPHWSDLAEGNEALMIFQGPEGYITPNWYPSKALHGKVVPTWNFAVVHAYGRPEVMKEKDWLLRHVTELTAQQKRNGAKPWAPTDAPDTYIEVMLRGIVGFRFAITRLKGKWKMSQNREVQDRVGVVKGLSARDTGDDLEMAEVVSRWITQSN